jgi:serine/threonine protein kinase
MGLVLYELKHYQEALASYGSALQHLPNYALAYAGQGRAYFSLGEYQKAIESFDLALDLDGTLMWAKTQREEAFRLLGTTTTSSMQQIEVLGERYRLQEPIGRGGMATIYRGNDMRMDRVVAIKVLREVYSTDQKFVTRFQREAKAASSLQHPNIVQVYDYGQSEGNYFIVMELVEGTNLRRYLRSRGVLAIDRAVIITHDIALGLGAAHRRQIVHRDVKPQNILVGRDGSIKLTDFGIASLYKDSNAERLTTAGMTLGTVQYYAPEQAQGEIVNPAADVYALGIVMYEMLTGRPPFEGDTPVAVAMQHIQDAPQPPRQLNPNIPPALEEIILRCLQKTPEMRYRDGAQLARTLESLGEEERSSVPSSEEIIPQPPTAPGMPQAWLTIRLPLARQEIYRIEKPVVNIGRQLSNDIVVEDKRVSRYHAQIKYEPDDQFVIFDLGSTNGITINNLPHVRQRVLHDGDRFTIGSYDFYFKRR